MKVINFVCTLIAISSVSRADVSYIVSDVGFNSCDCASTQLHDNYKIKPGNCIFSIT